MKLIIGIDPGQKQSGYVIYDPNDQKIRDKGIKDNEELIRTLRFDRELANLYVVAIEQPRGMGQTAGNELLDTAQWCGMFAEAAHLSKVELVPRREVKLHLVGALTAKDKNIREALIERFGEPGTKKNPGKLYGVMSHMLPALAVAVTAENRILKDKSPA